LLASLSCASFRLLTYLNVENVIYIYKQGKYKNSHKQSAKQLVGQIKMSFNCQDIMLMCQKIKYSLANWTINQY
jgi:hypothetical protein